MKNKDLKKKLTKKVENIINYYPYFLYPLYKVIENIKCFEITVIDWIDEFEHWFGSEKLDEAGVSNYNTITHSYDLDKGIEKAEWYDSEWYCPVIVSYKNTIFDNKKIKIFSGIEINTGEIKETFIWFYVLDDTITFYWQSIEELISMTIIDIIIDNNYEIDLNKGEEDIINDIEEI